MFGGGGFGGGMNLGNMMDPYDLGPGQNMDPPSDAPTDEGFDSDGLLDPPIQNVGDKEDVTHDGKVKKEILVVGEGVKKPKRNFIAKIIYSAYFYNHEVFDSSKDQVIEVALGDIAWPEGLWLGIEKMRKNEVAKIKITKKHGFGRKEQREKLRFSEGYTEEGEAKTRLMSKGIIYEVKLVDWIERVDIEADGIFLKQFITKPERKHWEKPADRDEIVLGNLKISQGDKVLFEKPGEWSTVLSDPELTLTTRKVIESMKRGEESFTLVKASYVLEQDQDLAQKLGDSFDKDQDLTITCELKSLIKVEDWFKDGGSSLKRSLRKGKGGTVNTDSTIKVLMKITVNDKVVLNNYPTESQSNPSEWITNLTEEQKSTLEKEDPTLFSLILDKYNLPSLLIKVLKSMKKYEVSEFITTKIDKLRTNFKNDYFDQYELFQEGDKVSFLLTLVSISEDIYFYQMKVSQKLARVLHLKGVAGQFFKEQNYRKAAKIYQKINGYYNFGDATNNQAQEEGEEYEKLQAELLAIKITTFLNLVVCKHKLKEYQSVVNITDQILEMDPNNVKALYFRGFAHLELLEYSPSVECLTKLCQVDPNHTDGRNLLAKAKKAKKDYLEGEHRKFSKMFS